MYWISVFSHDSHDSHGINPGNPGKFSSFVCVLKTDLQVFQCSEERPVMTWDQLVIPRFRKTGVWNFWNVMDFNHGIPRISEWLVFRGLLWILMESYGLDWLDRSALAPSQGPNCRTSCYSMISRPSLDGWVMRPRGPTGIAFVVVSVGSCGDFLKWAIPKSFKSPWHGLTTDLDDLGYPHDLGKIHTWLKELFNFWRIKHDTTTIYCAPQFFWSTKTIP